MLIATIPYVRKRLHLDPDPKLNYGSGSEHANNFGSGRIRIHNPDGNHTPQYTTHAFCPVSCKSTALPVSRKYRKYTTGIECATNKLKAQVVSWLVK